MKNENNSNGNKKAEWANRHLRIHLKKKQLDAPDSEKIRLLKKRQRGRKWMIVANIVAILFFGYSFYSDITQLGDILLYILFAVFVINIILIFNQIRQLKRLIGYFEERRKEK